MKKRILVWLLAMLILFPLFPAFTAEAAYNEVDTRPYSRAVLSMNKTELDKVGRQTESGPCGCYALAYCRTILDGYAHSWTEFDGSGTHESSKAWASWTSGTYTPEFPNEGQKDLAFQLLYQSITNGKPAIVKVTFPNSQHYVAVVGYENVTRHGPLSAANFLILDSAASTRNVYNMAELNYDILAQNGCYQVVLSSSDESVGFSSSTPMDEEPPVVSDIFTAGMGYGDSGVTGFTLTFDVTDNVGVTQCWCDVWEYGKESEARHLPVTVSGNQGRVNVNLADFNTNTGLFLARAYAYDVAGNQSLISQLDLNSALSFFSSKADKKYIATYKVKADGTAYYIAPSKTYNGKTTCVGSLSKDRKVSTVGVVNADAGNDAWLELEDGTWIRYGDVTRCNWWTNLIDTIKNFFDTYVFVWNRQLVTGNTKVTLNAITYTAANTGGDGPITPTVTPCIVSFDGNGGTVPTLSNTAFPGSSFGSLPTPSRFGYSFDGWFTAADGGSQITSDSVCSGDITLYAHWTRIILSQGSCGDNLTYIHYGDGILEIIGSGDMTSHPWESHKVRVLEVYLPDGLTSICNDAFNGCQYLEEINIPDNVTSIGNMAFAFTGLTSLTLPNQIEYLGYGILWANTGVKELSIPKTLSSIGTTSRWIDAEPFGHIYAAVSVLSVSHVERLIFESGTTEIFNCFAQRSYYLKEVVLPDTVTKIGNSAFEVTTCLETINIPDSVISIGNYAFAETGLTQLTLPRYVEHLGHGILWGTQDVKEITIPKTVLTVSQESRWIDQEPYGNIYGSVGVLSASYVEKLVFEPGSTYIPHQIAQHAAYLKEVIIPDTVTQIDYSAFDSCVSLTTLTIPNSVTTIGNSVFSNSALAELAIPDSVTTIGNYAFAYTQLTQLTLPRYLEHLGIGVLWGNNGVKELTIPKTLKSSGVESRWIDMEPFGSVYADVGALSLSSVETLIFEAGTATILDRIAQRDVNLKEVTIPETVNTIGSSAFVCCYQLESITIPESVTTIKSYAFAGSGLKSAEIPDSVTNFNEGAFQDCSALASVKLPAHIADIPMNCFARCSALQRIEMPEPVQTIKESAFVDCGALAEIVWSNAPKQIEANAFRNCDSLTAVTFPATVTTIGNRSFQDCDLLVSVTLPDSVTSLGTSSFYNCHALTEVKLGNGLTAIPASAFEHCDVLESIVIPYRVSSIGAKAFKDCVAFREITIPRATTTIASDAFSYYDKLTIYGVPGTYAETYANEKGINFVGREVNATAVVLSETTMTLCKGQNAKLLFTAEPANFTDEVVWRSSNTSVATIADDGTVKAVDLGTATIKLMVGNVSVNCRVTVVQPVTRINLNNSSITMQALDTFQLTTTVTPSNAYNKEIVWSSSDENVATVDETGLVTALKKGTAKITAAAQDGSGKTASCTVTVSNSATICRTVEEFESPHNYPNNCSDFWVYTYAGAEELAVSFDGRTEMEEDFDFLRIFDGAGSMIGEYTGTALAGQTVTVSGDTVRIQIVSDSAGSTWGFKVSAVRRTAVETLTLPADLTAIESEAFAGLAQPVNVEIPEGVTSIAEDAFKDSDVTIVAKADSYAIAWAQEHNVPFVIDDD